MSILPRRWLIFNDREQVEVLRNALKFVYTKAEKGAVCEVTWSRFGGGEMLDLHDKSKRIMGLGNA